MNDVYDTPFCETCPFWCYPDVGDGQAFCTFSWFDPDEADGFIPDCSLESDIPF